MSHCAIEMPNCWPNAKWPTGQAESGRGRQTIQMKAIMIITIADDDGDDAEDEDWDRD